MERAKEFGGIYGVAGSLSRGGGDGNCRDNFSVAGGDFFLYLGVLVGGDFKASFPALNVVGWQGLIMSLSYHFLVISPTCSIF